MERDPDCIPFKQPSAQKPYIRDPKLAFTSVSDYKQNFNSNYHQEMASGAILFESTMSQRFKTLKYT